MSTTRRATLNALAVTTALTIAAAAPAAATPSAGSSTAPLGLVSTDCTDPGRELTPEEAYLQRPEAARFVAGGGFDRNLRSFQQDLCAADFAEDAQRLVERHGSRLWRDAVRRAQGDGPQRGQLSAGDDRPLYWTRLAMVATLRQWAPQFGLADAERQGLVDRMDRVSRGQEDIRFPAGKGQTRVLVTGFDPFTLFRDVRQANPSGAAALALDGTVVETADGPVRLETAIFPVRWRDFEEGMVEETLLPHFQEGRRQIDAFATVSQGRPGQFDLEAFNGAWRAGFTDNEEVCYRGQVPLAEGVPTVEPQPQWTRSTLPRGEMVEAGTGPFPVIDNREVEEVPGDTPSEPVTTECPAASSPGTVREDGPTPGSQARAGGGGNYLSNEIAYRATLLRDATGLDVPGGHIHTPVLEGLDTEDRSELTNAAFEANRAAISDQVRSLVLQAARSTRD